MSMRGALLLSVVYQHSPGIHKQFNRGKEVFPGTRGGRVPKLAGLPTPWAKEIFTLFFSKHKGFSC